MGVAARFEGGARQVGSFYIEGGARQVGKLLDCGGCTAGGSSC